ncbi:MAG: pyridoxamine 5'-phosphate oxidase [Candidatus Eremiobacteraeota bacterium]|nr:pyridoxamine 5'-phosphate oxidase [Candidatus Eremiobacteraeota bacterium]
MSEPFARLAEWIGDAGGMDSLEAIAMCVATVNADARPSARIVLLRGLDERGLRFFTSYLSRKGRELAENPHAAAVLYWPGLHRQVRIEGDVAPLSEVESDDYFDARPRGHRIAAWASEQSEPLESYSLLEERYAHFDERFEEAVPRPHSWGGYLLIPARIEFWQGRPNRLHERTLFTRDGTSWTKTLLQP